MDTVTVYRINGSLENAFAFEMTPEELYSSNFVSEPELWRQVFKYPRRWKEEFGDPTKRVLWQPHSRSVWPYLISSHGRIMSLGGRNGAVKGLLMAQSERPRYLYSFLRKPKQYWQPYTHVLMAWAFCGPPEERGMQASHEDGERFHNVAWNIRWRRPEENLELRNHHCYGHPLNGNGDGFSSDSMTDEEFANAYPF